MNILKNLPSKRMNMMMAGIGGRLSILVCITFLLNTFLVCYANSSPDSRFSHSAPPLVSSASSNSTTVTNTIEISQNVSDNNAPLWKQQLPFPLNNKTKTLQRILVPRHGYPKANDESCIDSCVEVFLLGTAHVSKDSSRDVRLLLESVKPDVIFLELCHQRLNLLEPSDEADVGDDVQVGEVDTGLDTNLNATGGRWNFFRKIFRHGKNPRTKKKQKSSNEKRIDTRSFSSIASSLLTNVQVDYADSLDVELGGEFLAAYEYWKRVVPRGNSSFRKVNRINNVHMILGDRPVSLTLARAWESLRVWGKIKLMIGLLVSSLRKPNIDEIREWMENILNGDTDMMSEAVAEMAKHFPTLADVILKERDAYMACKLKQTCQSLLVAGSHGGSNRRHRLVAIVGAGHIEGICRWLTTGGSVTTISTVSTKTTSLASSTTTGAISDESPESPEDILSKLIQIKATIPKEDHDYLVNEITQLNPEQIDQLCCG